MVEGNFKTPDYLSLTHILSPRKLPGAGSIPHYYHINGKFNFLHYSYLLITSLLPSTITLTLLPSSPRTLVPGIPSNPNSLHNIWNCTWFQCKKMVGVPSHYYHSLMTPSPVFYLSSKPNNHPPPIKKKIPFINQSTNATSIERSILKTSIRTVERCKQAHALEFKKFFPGNKSVLEGV